MRSVPLRVRALLYLYYASAALAGIGLLGFILSFGQVGSSAQALIDVHEDVPVLAYASIGVWVTGLGVMWYSRRTLDAAVREKMKQTRDAGTAGAVDGPDGSVESDATDA